MPQLPYSLRKTVYVTLLGLFSLATLSGCGGTTNQVSEWWVDQRYVASGE